jgi:hypothetical protein
VTLFKAGFEQVLDIDCGPVIADFTNPVYQPGNKGIAANYF